ncbi:Asp-tRNA(Asn)/Glu-tRNA(Gln) amidotransferase subunit GatC [Anaerocolumna sp. MB42-C2]|uniref:Asp-tRNA(Asn)/Glu-tRNA(Gln) amidotransferase subunit GatC n=1 Tax=Anaerocolumna sp. MB42-C2 TaxID=3070997 RepID=UPI002ED34BD2
MAITDETIEYVAALAKLDLNGEEKEKAKKDLGSILAYMDTMNELDTDHIEPMSHVFPIRNVFREDVVVNEPNREMLLSNAPASKDGCFMVPKTVE